MLAERFVVVKGINLIDFYVNDVLDMISKYTEKLFIRACSYMINKLISRFHISKEKNIKYIWL